MVSRKEGSILLKNVVFLSIILVIYLAIFRLENVNILSIEKVVTNKRLMDNIELIKNELYFNNQYKYLENDTYISKNALINKDYKEFKDTFESSSNDYLEYFHIKFDKQANLVNISYIKNQEILFEDELTI